jgi:hypothetical protein
MNYKKIYPVLLLLFLLPVYVCAQKAHYRWKTDSISVGLIKVTPDAKDFLLWQLNFDPAMKPFFHPVYSPDGTLLSAEAPADHLWHLGQWFCWKYINKLNYWEYTGDPKNAVSEGRTALKNVQVKTRNNGQASVEMHIEYHPWDQPAGLVMKETRNITVTAPGKDGSYSIDYDMIFTALTDVVLDRTPVQTNAAGVKWGGYAGLSMRFDQKLSNPRYYSQSRDSVINGEGNSWVAANLTTPAGTTVQVVILDHPGNPRHPSAWYTINRPNDRFWFFSPALLYHSELELKAGETMRLRYKVLIPAKPLTREEIHRAEGRGQRAKIS